MSQPSPNVHRALRLLRGAMLGGHLAWLVALGIFAVLAWPAGAASAAAAGLATLAFLSIGQAVQVLVADAPPKKVMVAALASYLVRVTLFGLALMLVLANPDRIGLLDPVAVVVTAVMVVIGWLVAEVRVYSRLRIPVYDEPENPSSTAHKSRPSPHSG